MTDTVPPQYLTRVQPGYLIRRLAGLHGVSHVHLAEYIGSAKQTLGPILAGKKGLGKELTDRLAGAFWVPSSMLLDGNLQLTLAVGMLTLDLAPIASFVPREGDHPPEYREERIAASKKEAHDAWAFHVDHPEVMREAFRIIEAMERARAPELQ